MIIAYANALIAGNSVRYGKNITGTKIKGSAPVILTESDINREATKIATLIKTQLKNGAEPDGIAVIYRLNIQARALSDAFLHMNIPFKVRDETPSIYQHWMAADFAAYLRLSQNRQRGYDADAWRIINKPYRYISKAFLAAAKKADTHIFDTYKNSPVLHPGQRNAIYELIIYLSAIKKLKTCDAIKYIRKTVGYDTYIGDHSEYRKLDPTGLYEIADELQEAARPFDKPNDFLTHMEEAIGIAKESKTIVGPCVTLTTMHSAKGLEFDTVFIAGAVEGVMPHDRSKTGTELEEERRLLYVAVTRARRLLYISAPKMRYEKAVKPSRFLNKMV
jgi:DNA helicase-2/ATP-dependent DNA helicase PcrA